jgi:hypothetical protein
MNIRLHIDRLVLDGLNVSPGQGELVKASVEAELTRLLMDGGLGVGLHSGGAVPSIRTDTIEFAGKDNPLRQGEKIARSIYSGIGENK